MREIILNDFYTRWKSVSQIMRQGKEVIKNESPYVNYELSYDRPYDFPVGTLLTVELLDYIENVFIKFKFKKVSKNYYEGSSVFYKGLEKVSFRLVKKTKKHLTVMFTLKNDITITEVLEEIPVQRIFF